jgi:hypothetical protein
MTEEIHIELSWARAVPLLLEIYTNAETPKARREAREELMRCARIADDAATLVAKVRKLPERLEAQCVCGRDDWDRGHDHAFKEAARIVRATVKVDTPDPSPEPASA